MAQEQSPQPISADWGPGVSANGVAEVYTLDGPNMTLAHTQGGLVSTWDLLIPGSYAEFGEHTDLLFYDRSAGTGTFLTTDMDGSLQLLKWHKGWRKSWTQIVSGSFLPQPTGNESLLFYDRAAGHGEFYVVDGKGGISLVAKHTNWRKSWDQIVPGPFLKGQTFSSLIFYDRAAGQGELYRQDGQGNISLAKKYSGWSKSWNNILTYRDFGNDINILLFYDRAAGLGEFYAVDPNNGDLLPRAKHTNWSKRWDVIIPCRLSQNIMNGLLFYERAAGLGEFYQVDNNGNLTLVAKHTNWRHTWHAIAAGTFVGVGEPSLLFYQR
ncbi:hypothetical protein [Vitiosangium sp. GDMCC 1.1324]|uniref:hypothetical protein n=1 Tax=Vitiosangium sp. (strain GDMCC 1.1324) TaxID=2138576 RepID=UPI0011B64CB3|nr:hypothetical protein [Vitiosangium sp. GDMCC 1.1324]